MLQRWPGELRGVYSLAVLTAAAQWVKCLQLVPASSNTTVQQLCGCLRNTACLMRLASDVHQAAAPSQHNEQVWVLKLSRAVGNGRDFALLC